MTTARTRRIAALAASLALPLALLVAAPASAATVGVTNWTDLKAAFLVDGDTVRLDSDIIASAGQNLVVQAGENITLDLNGFALTIDTPGSNNAAISVPPTSSLTINDTSGGTLTATGGFYGAGIGGGIGIGGGTVTITGGTVTAGSGEGGAGIGGGFNGDGGTLTVTGGTVIANGGNGGNGGPGTYNAAGIGGGNGGDGGTTTINGGTLTATGGYNAAGIGGGDGGSAGVLQVNGTLTGGGATNGGDPVASPITNPTTPAGVGYSATTSTVSGGGRIVLRFNYLITFTTSGGSTAPADQTINDGDTLPTPAAPTRESFSFAGWTASGSAYDFTTPVTAPLTLSATWTAALAATGIEITTPLGIATLLTIGGAILIALRRRAAQHPA